MVFKAAGFSFFVGGVGFSLVAQLIPSPPTGTNLGAYGMVFSVTAGLLVALDWFFKWRRGQAQASDQKTVDQLLIVQLEKTITGLRADVTAIKVDYAADVAGVKDRCKSEVAEYVRQLTNCRTELRELEEENNKLQRRIMALQRREQPP